MRKITKDFYDEDYYKKRYAAPSETLKDEEAWKQQEITEAKARAFLLTRWSGAKKTLELGCGEGQMVEQFRQHGIDARGIDLSEYTTKGKEYMKQGDIVTAKYPKADLIYSRDVLEHLTAEDARKVLEKCRPYDYIFHSISVGEGDYGDVTFLDNMDKSHISMYSPSWWLKMFSEVFGDSHFIMVCTRKDYMEYPGHRFTNTNFFLSKKAVSDMQII